MLLVELPLSSGLWSRCFWILAFVADSWRYCRRVKKAVTQLFGQKRESEDVVLRRVERKVTRYIEQVRSEESRALSEAACGASVEGQFDDDAPTQILRARADSSSVAQAPPVTAEPVPAALASENDAQTDQPTTRIRERRPTDVPGAGVSPAPPVQRESPLPPPPGRAENRDRGLADTGNRSRLPAPLSGLRRTSPGVSVAVSLTPSDAQEMRKDRCSSDRREGEFRVEQAREGCIAGGAGSSSASKDSSTPAQGDSLDGLFGSTFDPGEDDFSSARSDGPMGVPEAGDHNLGSQSLQSARLGGVSLADRRGMGPEDELEQGAAPRVISGSGLLIIALAAGVSILIYFLLTSDRYVY